MPLNVFTEIIPRHWITLHGFAVFAGLAIYAAASHLLRQRRHPSASIAWLISLVVFPYLALPLYLMIGRRKIASPGGGRGHPSLTSDFQIDPRLSNAGRLAAAMGLPPASPFERLAIHQDGGHALRALHDMLATATASIDVCTFLLGRDVLGADLSALLMRRAQEGVRVRLMIDGIGVYLGGYPNLKRLSRAGVQVALFVSPLRSALRGRTNLRNHRKMVLVDGQRLWCGGRNLAAEYFQGDRSALHRKPIWIDLSFDLRGPLAEQGQQRFDQDWAFATQGTLGTPPPRPAGPATTTGMKGQIIASGPDQSDDTIYTLIVSGCFTAQSRILMVTPYFVPDSTLLMALTLAARRGITVDLLLPRHSNHRLADIARHAALRELTAAGARVWLAPAMVHAKAVLIDRELALVGSANLDERSLFLNYELMVAFYDPAVVMQFSDWIERHQRQAQPYRSRPPGLALGLLEGMVRWAAFQL